MAFKQPDTSHKTGVKFNYSLFMFRSSMVFHAL